MRLVRAGSCAEPVLVRRAAPPRFSARVATACALEESLDAVARSVYGLPTHEALAERLGRGESPAVREPLTDALFVTIMAQLAAQQAAQATPWHLAWTARLLLHASGDARQHAVEAHVYPLVRAAVLADDPARAPAARRAMAALSVHRWAWPWLDSLCAEAVRHGLTAYAEARSPSSGLGWRFNRLAPLRGEVLRITSRFARRRPAARLHLDSEPATPPRTWHTMSAP